MQALQCSGPLMSPFLNLSWNVSSLITVCATFRSYSGKKKLKARNIDLKTESGECKPAPLLLGMSSKVYILKTAPYKKKKKKRTCFFN